MEVLDHVDAVPCHPGVQEAEGGLDVLHEMTPIVENDIGRTEFVQQTLEHGEIGLIADPYGDLVLLKLGLVENVQSDDLGVGTEIALPELE